MRQRFQILTGMIICILIILTAGKIAYSYKEYTDTTEIMQKTLAIENSGCTSICSDDALGDNKPKIAITFDDGPSSKYTPMLLDGLKERNVKATFFIIGEKIDGNEELIRRIKDEGHIIGNHTYTHVQLTRLSTTEACEEIEKTNEKLSEVTGEWPQYIRAPFGSYNEKLETAVEMFPVSWTIDTLDWTTKNTSLIVKRGVCDAKENGIILLHDIYKSSVEAALQIIDCLQEEGYEFVTVEELMLE